MDFIIKLPPSKELITNMVFDSIIVAVDRLTKDVIFIPFKEIATADELAYIFLQDILAEHTLPDKLIMNQDKLFVSKFW